MHPALRDDLELHSGTPSFNGSPQWTIHDPIRNLFFSIDWITFEFISRWDLGEPAKIIQSITKETTLVVDEKDYETIFQFLLTNELLQIEGQQGYSYLTEQAKTRKISLITWLIHNYLFFRIPLFQSDNWLNRHQDKVDFFFKPFFLKLTLVIGLLGLIQIYNHFSDFSSSFVDMFSWQGLIAYFFALLAIKIIHELAHAFTAKRLGCRVPTIGVAFLVMMPLAYTDTNDVWKLKDRKSRLMVDSAGVIAELAIAAWSILIWSFLPLGTLKTIFYILGATSWINTLFINLSPFMRFDGYYTLSDFLRIGNLHSRAFAMAKWHFRKHIFGIEDDIPETLPQSLNNFLIIFAWITAIYRLVVFLSIAALVYHFFIKLVGIILFLIEIIWFIAMPIYSEIAFWFKSRNEILNNPKKHRAIYFFIFCLFIFLFPLDIRLKETGVLKPKDRYYIYATEPSQVLTTPPSNGLLVKKDDVLTQLQSPELSRQLNIASEEKALFEFKVNAASLDEDFRNNLQANINLLKMTENNLTSLQDIQKQLNAKSPFNGRYYELSPDIKEGDWIAKGTKLGMVINPNQWLVEAYFPEESIQRLKVGVWGKFFPETAGNDSLFLKLNSIDPTPVKVLSETIYASPMGGSVISKITNDKAICDQPYYKVTFISNHPYNFTATQRGTVVVFAKPQSILSYSIRHIMNLVRKEISF